MRAGEFISNKGVYISRVVLYNDASLDTINKGWGPNPDSDLATLRSKINKMFNLFASPRDLDLSGWFNEGARYNTAIQSISEMHIAGHSGAKYETIDALTRDLENGTYNGEWFLPEASMMKTIFEHQNTGQLGGTLRPNGPNDEDHKKHARGRYLILSSPSVPCTHINPFSRAPAPSQILTHSNWGRVRPVRMEITQDYG